MVTSRFISLKCFFSGNYCQNWTILEHNVPLYGLSIWSSRIIDPGLMTSLMRSSRIIIIDTKRATSQTSLPVSFTEVLFSVNRCALLRFAQTHTSERTMSPTGLFYCLLPWIYVYFPNILLQFCWSPVISLKAVVFFMHVFHISYQ